MLDEILTVYLVIVFKNSFRFFKIKEQKNTFDNKKKTIFYFLFFITENMLFLNNIF